MDNKTIIRFWQDFIDRQESNKFILNTDSQIPNDIATGILNNEKNKGFKYCPCKLPTGDKKKDSGLICPCNFKIQKEWRKKGECRCSLFVKDKRMG